MSSSEWEMEKFIERSARNAQKTLQDSVFVLDSVLLSTSQFSFKNLFFVVLFESLFVVHFSFRSCLRWLRRGGRDGTPFPCWTSWRRVFLHVGTTKEQKKIWWNMIARTTSNMFIETNNIAFRPVLFRIAWDTYMLLRTIIHVQNELRVDAASSRWVDVSFTILMQPFKEARHNDFYYFHFSTSTISTSFPPLKKSLLMFAVFFVILLGVFGCCGCPGCHCGCCCGCGWPPCPRPRWGCCRML